MLKDIYSTAQTEPIGGMWANGRAGMHEFLSRHAPSMLAAAMQEAERFCTVIDARASTTSTTADYWLYDMSDVYYSHIPLFAPSKVVAASSTIPVEGVLSAMPALQDDAVVASITHLLQRGIISASTDNNALHAALHNTQRTHVATRLKHTRNMNYVLIADISIDSFHTHDLSFTDHSVYAVHEITLAQSRSALYKILAQQSKALAAFWQTMIESYATKCYAAALPHHGVAGEWLDGLVHVLIPLDLQLKTFTLPVGASQADMIYIATQFCLGFRGACTQRDHQQCVSVLVDCMSDALAVALTQ
jgi:hypothetical protein